MSRTIKLRLRHQEATLVMSIFPTPSSTIALSHIKINSVNPIVMVILLLLAQFCNERFTSGFLHSKNTGLSPDDTVIVSACHQFVLLRHIHSVSYLFHHFHLKQRYSIFICPIQDNYCLACVDCIIKGLSNPPLNILLLLPDFVTFSKSYHIQLNRIFYIIVVSLPSCITSKVLEIFVFPC